MTPVRHLAASTLKLFSACILGALLIVGACTCTFVGPASAQALNELEAIPVLSGEIPKDKDFLKAGYREYAIDLLSPSGSAIVDRRVENATRIKILPLKVDWKYSVGGPNIKTFAGNGKQSENFEGWRYGGAKEYGTLLLHHRANTESSYDDIPVDGGEFPILKDFVGIAVNDTESDYADNSGHLIVLAKFLRD